jgi:hypothetical protein
MELNLDPGIPGMTLDIGKTLLNYLEEGQLDIFGHPPEIRSDFELHANSRALRETLGKKTNRICESGLIQ